MKDKKPTIKKKGHSEPVEELEPKSVLFSDIENIQMLVTVKGKSHLLVSKPNFETQSKIDMECALRLALDSHVIMDPSIDELEKMLKETTK
jgi:hypothetical protein